MEEQKKDSTSKAKKPRKHFPLGPILLIVFGVTWLLSNFGIVWVWKIWVPVVVIIVGVYMLFTKQRC